MSTQRLSHSFLRDAAYIHNIARGQEVAVAAEFGAVRLENPSTSDKDVVVLSAIAVGAATGAITAGITTATISTAPANSAMQTNRGAAYGGTTDILGDTDGTVTTYLAIANYLWPIIDEDLQMASQRWLWVPGQYIILPPGYGLTVVQTTANLNLDVSFAFADVE